SNKSHYYNAALVLHLYLDFYSTKLQVYSHSHSHNNNTMAQTPEQRRRNARFAKGNENRMGKSEDQIKKRVEKVTKSPISMFWIVILGFIVFGGLVFEALSRFFG
ncbi:hypothetical protein FZEAL_4960, partial [Fusarium zealandicum]